MSTQPDRGVIVGVGQTPGMRRPPAGTTSGTVLTDAILSALDDADMQLSDIDGLAIASYSLAPDHAIDFAWRLGISPQWLMEDRLGGVNGLNMLQHAVRAVEAGDAETVLVVAGDRLDNGEFADLANNYSGVIRDELAPLNYGGFNTLFAMLTTRHMEKYDLTRRDYGQLVVSQRAWASQNPYAAYQAPLSLDEYLDAEIIVPPLSRYDCVPWAAGAQAFIVSRRANLRHGPAVGVRAQKAAYNFDHQEGDGLSTGASVLAAPLREAAGMDLTEVDLLQVYDDYPAMVLVQLEDLGFFGGDSPQRFLHDEITTGRTPLNTAGGQLSAGQWGAAAGTQGIVEAALQLRGAAGERQVAEARTALVVGYGSVIYRYAACSAAAVLEVVA